MMKYWGREAMLYWAVLFCACGIGAMRSAAAAVQSGKRIWKPLTCTLIFATFLFALLFALSLYIWRA